MKYSLGDLAQKLGAEALGDENIEISGLATLSSAGPGQLAFLADSRYQKQLSECRASAVIVPASLADNCPAAALIANDPYLTFARATALFDVAPKPPQTIHSTAVVAESAVLGERVSIGPHAVIGEGCTLANDVIVEAGCVIAEDCDIGERSRLYPRVTLYYGVKLGSDVTVHSAVVIGSDGFGFAPVGDGWQKIHQLGRVVIGDRVEIGAGTTIDRGALDDTVIEDDVIIDDQVMIAHNVHIGTGTAMAGLSAVAGSGRVGKRCRVGGGVGIIGHISVADRTTLTARTLVTNSITEPGGSYSSGTPCLESRRWRKSAVRFGQLDELNRRVAALEKSQKTDG